MAGYWETNLAGPRQQPLNSAAHRRRCLPWCAAVLIGAWVAVLAVVWWANVVYQFTPARGGQFPSQWPSDSQLDRDGAPALVIFLHAYCPCSRATLHELQQVMARIPAAGRAFCVVTYPASQERAESDLVNTAREIPRLQVTIDDSAEESARFGATASGTLLYYDAGGALQFAGGITASRGHEGANPGVDALLAAFGGERGGNTKTPVFGCGLPTRSAGHAPTNSASGAN
ncbi:MAG TPA: hypothetical protein VHY20_10995 [Pirellulales bacterium]|nr:hypothetical protein [Pirellulales bacterium]